jgi:hypothetical protein
MSLYEYEEMILTKIQLKLTFYLPLLKCVHLIKKDHTIRN